MWAVTSIRKLASQLEAKIESHIHVPWVMATGCCKVELENVSAATYDWRRIGIVDLSSHPSEADVMIVAGWINEAVADQLKSAYSELVGPRSVIAVGACAISGSPYAAGAEKIIRVSDILPVDVYVPGCPPRPEVLLDAIQILKTKRRPKISQMEVLYDALKGPT